MLDKTTKVVLNLNFALLLVFGCEQLAIDNYLTNCDDSDYIEMQYQGDSDKAHPKLIFYIDSLAYRSSLDTIYQFYGTEFKVSRDQFKEIKKIVQNKNISNYKLRMLNNFSIYVFENKKGSDYMIHSKSEVSQIFQMIYIKLKNFHKCDSLKTWFDIIISRIR